MDSLLTRVEDIIHDYNLGLLTSSEAEHRIQVEVSTPRRQVCINGALDWALPTADEFPEITNDPPIYGEIKTN